MTLVITFVNTIPIVYIDSNYHRKNFNMLYAKEKPIEKNLWKKRLRQVDSRGYQGVKVCLQVYLRNCYTDRDDFFF